MGYMCVPVLHALGMCAQCFPLEPGLSQPRLLIKVSVCCSSVPSLSKCAASAVSRLTPQTPTRLHNKLLPQPQPHTQATLHTHTSANLTPF